MNMTMIFYLFDNFDLLLLVFFFKKKPLPDFNCHEHLWTIAGLRSDAYSFRSTQPSFLYAFK